MSALGKFAAPDRATPFDSLPSAALLMRGDRVVAVNPAYVRFIGASPEAVVGRTLTELIGRFVAPADAALAGAAAESYHAGRGAEGQLWLRVIDVAGEAHFVRVDWRPHGDGGESIVSLVDAEGEASARAAAEALARAAGQLGRCRDEREVLERAADVLHARGLIVTTLLLREGDPFLEYGPMRNLASPDGRAPSEVSRQFTAVRPRREILWELNKDFHQRRAAFFQDVGPLIVAAYPGQLGERIQSQVPERRTVQAPLFVNDAPYGALVLTSDDLTPGLAGSIELFAELVARAIENVRLRTELVHRERLAALGEAAAVMAHEVRNPVSSILNAASLLQKEGLDGGVQAALLQVIGEESRRLDRLVTDLLDLVRPLSPRVSSVDLYDLAQRSVGILADRGQAIDVRVEVVRPEAPVVAEIDPDLVQLALWNVVRNAVQASPTGKRVTVAAETRGDRASLVVDDEGRGFPPDQIERLLEPFYTTRATGTGVGLAVVRRVVEACRGGLQIGSSPSGGGRFLMWFPAAAGGGRARLPPDGGAAHGEGQVL